MINRNFPNSATITGLFDRIEGEAKKKGFDTANMLIAKALCIDESTFEFDREIEKRYVLGQFSMQTLSGIPICGITSFCAFYHHIPDKGIGAVVFGPHIGISSENQFGKLNRKGIKEVSSSCGANCAIIKKWQEQKTVDKKLDPELSNLWERVAPSQKIIMQSNMPLLALTEEEYQIGLKTMVEYITEVQKTERHKYYIMLIAGIHIDMPQNNNKEKNEGNRFQIRNIIHFENGEITDNWNYK